MSGHRRSTRPAARPWAPLLAVLLGLTASGCASYPQRVAGAVDDLRRGRLEQAAAALEDTDGFLGAAEAGAVRLAAGDWEAARASLDQAAVEVDEVERRGPLSARSLTEDVGTLLVNERASTYEGEGFERVQVHAMLALTYFALGRLDSVGVEVRRANKLLEREEELYEAKYAAGGLGHFLSALAYEIRGDFGDALIDYRRMDEKGLAPTLVGPELLRLATKLDREDLLPDLRARYGEPAAVPKDYARVVLVAGVGLAPVKVEASLRVPTSAGIVAFAVPEYVRRQQPVASLELRLEEVDVMVRSVVVEDIARVAEKNLSDRLARLALRSAARATTRTVASKQLRDSDKHLAALAVDLFSLFAERADLRSWTTLPDSWQVAQVWVPPGSHTLRLDAVGGSSAQLGQVELVPGETAVIVARTIDRGLYAHLLGGGRPTP